MALLDQQEQGFIEPSTVSPRPTGMRWGLILGLVSVVFSMFFIMTGMLDLSKQSFFTLPNLVNWALTIGIFYYAFTQHRDNELGGYMSLGRAMSLGFWIALVSGVIAAVFMYVYMTFINPEFITAIFDNAMEQAEQRGQDPEQVRQGMEMMSWMFSPVFFGAIAIIGSVIMGLIFSLIIGLIVKKDAPRPF